MFLAIICTAFAFLASLQRVSFSCLRFSPFNLDSAGMLSLLFECIFACLLGFGTLRRLLTCKSIAKREWSWAAKGFPITARVSYLAHRKDKTGPVTISSHTDLKIWMSTAPANDK
ncbi:hypothetical protein MPLB_1490064 [Mesorhizobium sp. ORS 3324]|nr:hypothetical protein MPLB_1490064 [Mesorhizobium sp. ORS 3324]